MCPLSHSAALILFLQGQVVKKKKKKKRGWTLSLHYFLSLHYLLWMPQSIDLNADFPLILSDWWQRYKAAQGCLGKCPEWHEVWIWHGAWMPLHHLHQGRSCWTHHLQGNEGPKHLRLPQSCVTATSCDSMWLKCLGWNDEYIGNIYPEME